MIKVKNHFSAKAYLSLTPTAHPTQNCLARLELRVCTTVVEVGCYDHCSEFSSKNLTSAHKNPGKHTIMSTFVFVINTFIVTLKFYLTKIGVI